MKADAEKSVSTGKMFDRLEALINRRFNGLAVGIVLGALRVVGVLPILLKMFVQK